MHTTSVCLLLFMKHIESKHIIPIRCGPMFYLLWFLVGYHCQWAIEKKWIFVRICVIVGVRGVRWLGVRSISSNNENLWNSQEVGLSDLIHQTNVVRPTKRKVNVYFFFIFSSYFSLSRSLLSQARWTLLIMMTMRYNRLHSGDVGLR